MGVIMKIDCGFFDINGNYKEDIQEMEMLSVKELNEIELIKSQNKKLKEQNKDLQKQVLNLKAENTELKAENDKLKEEVETRDNLIDHFRDEALYRATIASEYEKDKTKLERTLREIKEKCNEARRTGRKAYLPIDILDVITKAEEE